MVYLVTWDLNKEKPNYAQARKDFLALLDKLTNHKDTGLDSVRFVATNKWDANDLSTYLRAKLDKNDRLFITRIHLTDRNGWLNKETWAWIREHE